MKSMFLLFAALVFVLASNQAFAQSQEDQQACQGDVYALCGDKIPDQDAIVVCLRKKWSKVSKECRHVMANYGKNHNKHRRKSRSDGANSSRY